MYMYIEQYNSAKDVSNQLWTKQILLSTENIAQNVTTSVEKIVCFTEDFRIRFDTYILI